MTITVATAAPVMAAGTVATRLLAAMTSTVLATLAATVVVALRGH